MSKDNTALLVRLFRSLPREAIKSLIAKGKYDFRLKKLSSEDHFLCLLIGQVAGCHSLRELEHFLKVSDGRLQQLGLSQAFSDSTLSHANNHRPPERIAAIAMAVIEACHQSARELNLPFAKGCPALGICDQFTAFDGSIINGSAAIIRGSSYAQSKGGVKVHLRLDCQTFMPEAVRINEGGCEIEALKSMPGLPGAITAKDRGLCDDGLWTRFSATNSFFVTRLKANQLFQVLSSNAIRPVEDISIAAAFSDLAVNEPDPESKPVLGSCSPAAPQEGEEAQHAILGSLIETDKMAKNDEKQADSLLKLDLPEVPMPERLPDDLWKKAQSRIWAKRVDEDGMTLHALKVPDLMALLPEGPFQPRSTRDARKKDIWAVHFDLMVNLQAHSSEDLRLVVCRDAYGQEYALLTNNLALSAEAIAFVYLNRWEIERFFRTLKQNFVLKSFWGESAAAIISQVWAALAGFALIQLARLQRLGRGQKVHFSNFLAAIRSHIVAPVSIDLIFESIAIVTASTMSQTEPKTGGG
jgi:hypothetical protein